MNLEIKKNLASNWFKTLQNAFCDDICKIEKNKSKFKSTSWKRNLKKDEGGGEYRILQNGKVFDTFASMTNPTSNKFIKAIEKALSQ